MKKRISVVIKIGLPLVLAAAILWWMYRGIDWSVVSMALSSRRCWVWILLSMPFGITAQLFRAFRWKMVLKEGRISVILHSIFLSYASSLVVPRSGEVLRCGVVRRYDKLDFPKLVGSVVCERIIDMVMILLLALLVVVWQIPVFLSFMQRTGMSMSGIFARFTPTGWWVTVLSGVLIILTALWLVRRVQLFSRVRERLHGFKSGLLGVRKVSNPTLFIAYSIGIWVSYYLHFWVAFQCFDFTASLGSDCALVAFVVGCFAVLVPTPNGAGPWHFAVKTVLMLYGVNGDDGAIFALIVHTLQTLLVVLLGLYALMALSLTKIQIR